LVPGPVLVPWVGPARLVIEPGMWGATLNHYCGLQDFEVMAFLMHLLRPEDLFLDAGANVGVYSVLASRVAGAKSIAIEPGLQAATALVRNLRVNDLMDRVEVHQEAVGASRGTVSFTQGLNTLNHVAPPSETTQARREIPVTTLDEVLRERCPQLIKLDTEGYETPAIQGAIKTLGQPNLLALIMEFDGHGRRYGFDEAALHARLVGLGFAPSSYRPFERTLNGEPEDIPPTGNVLYLRKNALDEIRRRVSSANAFEVLGRRV